MKRILKCINVALLSACTGAVAYGKAVDENTAKKIGCNQLISVSAKGVTSPENLVTAYVATAQVGTKAIVDYYVFNIADGNGFVMVSGDDVVIPILAYSTESSFDMSNISPAAKDWVEGYQNQITAVIANNIPANEGTAEQWASLMQPKSKAGAKMTVVTPLVTTKWDQDGSYRTKCPTGTPTGCVATAAVQVMNFWHWPNKGVGYHTYTHPTYGAKSANFGATTYDWASLASATTVTGTSSTAAKNAVSTIMFHFGVAVNMNYGTSSSGAYTLVNESPIVNCSEYALKTYFKYKKSIRGVQRYYPTMLSTSAWSTVLKDELNAGRPILYSGHGTSGGHAWVCDGWQADGKFHFNWGWSGSGPDGYYTVDNLSPPVLGIGGGGGNFNSQQAVIIGIEPDTFATATGNIKLAAHVDCPTNSPSTYPVPAFSVNTKILNSDAANFTGDFCAQIFDVNMKYITTLSTLTAQTINAAATSATMTFTSSGTMYALVPGYYKIRIMQRTSSTAPWTPVGDNGDFINENAIIIGNSQAIELGKNLTLSTGTNMKVGQMLTVTSSLDNRSTGNFNGSIKAVFTNVATGAQTTVGAVMTGQTIFYNGSKDVSFTTSVTVAPGTYTVAIQHAFSTALTSFIYTGSDYYQNPVLVTVSMGGVGVNTPTPVADRISVYPNPASNLFNINMEGVNVSNITVTDIQGRRLNELKPDAGQTSVSVPVSDYAAGIYFVNLYTDGEIVTKKIIVAK